MGLLYRFIEAATSYIPALTPLRTAFRVHEGMKEVRALEKDKHREQVSHERARIEMSARAVATLGTRTYSDFRDRQTEILINNMGLILRVGGENAEADVLKSLEILSLSHGVYGTAGIPPLLVEAMLQSNQILQGKNNDPRAIFSDALMEKVSRLIEKQKAFSPSDQAKRAVEYKKAILHRHPDFINAEANTAQSLRAERAALVETLDYDHR